MNLCRSCASKGDCIPKSCPMCIWCGVNRNIDGAHMFFCPTRVSERSFRIRFARAAFGLAWLLLSVVGAFAQATAIPDSTVTPGVVRAITDDEIRATAWGKDARHVTPAMKREVFRRYHVSGVHDPSCGEPRCELDHLVPRACGGADDVNNLWPQAADYWHEKDLFEDWAARRVKDGTLTVEACQAMFLAPADWRDGFRTVFGRDP